MIAAEQPWDVRVTATQPNARQPWDVRIDGADTDANREWDVQVDGTVGQAALGIGGEQIVAMRILVDGAELDPRLIVSGITVTRTLEGSTAEFAVVYREDLGDQINTRARNPLGDPLTMFSPAGGVSKIDIEGGYITSTGLHWIRLLSDGIVDNSTRTNGVEVVNVVDKLGRHDQVPVTLVLDPGHGTPRDRVIQQLFELAGWNGFALEPMATMNKELQVVDDEAVSISRDLADTEGRAIFADKQGDLSNGRRLPKGDERIEWLFDEIRLLETPSVSISARSDTPTAVCLEGTEQIVRDDCGRRLERSVREVFSVHTRRKAAFSQGSGGALTAHIAAAQTVFEITERITTELEYECATLLSRRTIVEQWYVPQAARYNMAEDDTINSYFSGVWIYDPDASADDSALAYVWSEERFVVVSDILESFHYNDNGYQVEDVTQRAGYYVPRKHRVQVGGAAVVAVFGDGTGVSAASETFQLVETTTFARGVTGDDSGSSDENTQVTEPGFIAGTTETVQGWIARAGTEYQYANGTQSRDSSEVFGQVRRTQESYQALAGDSAHVATRIENEEGSPPVVSTEDRGGYLPAAPKLDLDQASRTEVQRIEHLCEAPWLEQTHIPRLLKASSRWAENLEELESECGRILREGNGVDVAYATFANFTADVAELHHLRFPSIGLEHDVWSETAEWRQDASSGVVITVCTGRIFPEL